MVNELMTFQPDTCGKRKYTIELIEHLVSDASSSASSKFLGAKDSGRHSIPQQKPSFLNNFAARNAIGVVALDVKN